MTQRGKWVERNHACKMAATSSMTRKHNRESYIWQNCLPVDWTNRMSVFFQQQIGFRAFPLDTLDESSVLGQKCHSLLQCRPSRHWWCGSCSGWVRQPWKRSVVYDCAHLYKLRNSKSRSGLGPFIPGSTRLHPEQEGPPGPAQIPRIPYGER